MLVTPFFLNIIIGNSCKKWQTVLTEKVFFAKINITKYIPPIDYALLINCPIQQLDTSGNLVEEFVSAVEASRKTNISINWIRDALSGRQQQAGGFVWRLLDAIEERPSQEVVSAYQRQDVIRIRQENYYRQRFYETALQSIRGLYHWIIRFFTEYE